jgi:hypothetical protein
LTSKFLYFEKSSIVTIKNLVKFINGLTNNGVIFPSEPWGEGVGLEEEGEKIVCSLSTDDWLALRETLSEKNDIWIEFLIAILDEADTKEAREMMIYIALNGTDENCLDAMEHIREFQQDVDSNAWLKIRERSSEILSQRLKISYTKKQNT